MSRKKKNITDYINNLVDDQGIKTDITVNVTDTTLFKLAGTLFVTGTAITMMVFGIRAIVKNAEATRALKAET